MEKKPIKLKNQKLSFRKETLTELSKEGMNSVKGGEEAGGSTCVNLTCSWCTSGGATDPSTREDFTCSWCTTIEVSVSVR